ncbi:MAG: DUF29 domain-containing protein [Acidobacteriota bacterium]
MKALGTERLYDVDFYRWTQRVAELLRDRRLDEIDLEHVADEIADMGKRDRRELRSRMIILLMHLLKWQLQPKLRDGSTWLATIVEQRRQIWLVLEDSPSLHGLLENELPLLYMRAARAMLKETGLPDNLPPGCPYTADQVLDDDFIPDARRRVK